jgi:hypothetical protein
LIVGADAWVRSLAQLITESGFSVLLVDSNWTHVTAARRIGLRANYGNILAEQAMDELELDGIGRLLALTSNDEVNSLAALHFGDVFGRSRVFQLPVAVEAPGNRELAIPQHLRGRTLFGNGVTHHELSERHGRGAVFKRTTLTDEFGYEAFQARYGETAIPMFLLKSPGDLSVVAAADKQSPKPGLTLISLVGPEDDTVGRRES